MARESDLRTGNMRATYLTSEVEPVNFIWEAIFSAFFAAGLAIAGKYLPSWFSDPAILVFHEVFRLSLDATEAGMAALAILVLTPIALWVWYKQLRSKRKLRVHHLVIRSLQRISDLYVHHSTLGGRLQRAQQMRVRTEAKMHQYSGLSWQEIAGVGGISDMQGYLNVIAESGRQRIADDREFNEAGGDYWLEMLRAALRGELPGFLCFYVATAWENRYASRTAKISAISRWRREALSLCRAERKVFGRDSGHKKRAYGGVESLVRKVKSFSTEEFVDLMICWQTHFPLPVLRRGDEFRRFVEVFRSWVDLHGEPKSA